MDFFFFGLADVLTVSLAGTTVLVFDSRILGEAGGIVDTVLDVGSSSKQNTDGVDDGESQVSIAFLVAASMAKRLP